MSTKRWAIYIDIEGFSVIYPSDDVKALLPLNAVMEGIYRIGTTACARSPNRLFVHQTGDGFAIISDFGLGAPNLPVAISIVLLRLAVVGGGLAKVGISEGEFADIQGCYPEIISQHSDSHGSLRLGEGFMRIFPVMGTALISAHRVANAASGSLLLLDPAMAAGLGPGVRCTQRKAAFVAVDWVHTSMPEIDHLVAASKLSLPDSAAIERFIRQYIRGAAPPLKPLWVRSTASINRCR